jgi:3-oxoacid CoA-transferase subunit A
MNKIVQSASDAVADITSGSTLAVGGFGLCGIPDALIAAINDGDATDLEVYSNNCGVDDYGLGMALSR